jgi:ribonucleotide reductase alpha subunit
VTSPCLIVLLSEHFVGMTEGFAAIRKLQGQRLKLQLWVEEAVLAAYSVADIIRLSGVDDLVWPQRMALHEPGGDSKQSCVHTNSPPTRAPDAAAHAEADGSRSPLLPISQHTAACKQSEGFTAADLLFIPVLSLSLLGRIAALDTGHPFVRLILQALCAGKPVGALSLSADPDNWAWSEQGYVHIPPLLREEMNSLLAKAAGYGIHILVADAIQHWLTSACDFTIRPQSKQIITAEDVESVRRLGRSRMALQPQALVTPLAADLARQYGIKLHPHS